MNTYVRNVEIKPLLLAIGFWAFVLLLTPQSANAEWYWLTIPEDPTIGEITELSAIEYAVTSIPKDQLQAVEDSFFETIELTEDSIACGDGYSLTAVVKQLRSFDAENDFYKVTETIVPGDVKPGTFYTEFSTTTNQTTIDGRDKLFKSIETKANDCLEKERQQIDEQIREEKIKAALNECDFDFFENEMTNEERMNTWDERKECTTKTEEVTPEPVVPVAEEIVAPPKTTLAPEAVSAPVTAPKPVVTIPSATQTDNTVIDAVDEATTTDGNAQETIEEVAEETVQTEPEQTEEVEEPSFFKKIANFFTRLFKW